MTAEKLVVFNHAAQKTMSDTIVAAKKLGTLKDSFNRLVNSPRKDALNANTWRKLLLPVCTGPNGINKYRAETLRQAARQLGKPVNTFVDLGVK